MPTADDFSAARRAMIDEQLIARGIRDARVLAAMESVPREAFLPADQHGLAYSDQAVGIECRQTISQPYIVALMSEALRLGGGERVLEVGTGSGYQTAILSRLAAEVVSIERHEPLAREATALLTALGCANVRVVVGDGMLGYPQGAPFDRIMITAATETCPPPLLDQLAEGGLLVAPIGSAHEQMLQVLEKRNGQTIATPLCPCRFVPLLPGLGN